MVHAKNPPPLGPYAQPTTGKSKPTCMTASINITQAARHPRLAQRKAPTKGCLLHDLPRDQEQSNTPSPACSSTSASLCCQPRLLPQTQLHALPTCEDKTTQPSTRRGAVPACRQPEVHSATSCRLGVGGCPPYRPVPCCCTRTA